MLSHRLLRMMLIPALAVLVPVFGVNATVVDVSLTEAFRFVPQDISIEVGDTVRWTNQTFATHTVTSGDNCAADGLWDSGNLGYLDEFQRVFDTAGVFPYHCSTPGHCPGGMVGTVTVTEVSADPGITLHRYLPVAAPVSNVDKAAAKPLGVGSRADGGDTVDILFGYAAVPELKDLYLALLAPVPLGTGELMMILPDGSIEPFSVSGLAPWMSGTGGPVSTSLYGPVPVAALPAGTYTLFAASSPAGAGLSSLTIWQTEFSVGDLIATTSGLSGDAQLPTPVVTDGNGTGTVVINPDSGELSGQVIFSGLSSNTMFAHIHQQNPGEVTGPVLITLEGGDGVQAGTYRVPSGTVLTTEQVASLTAGELYYNIHTETNPPGEIRGQILYPADPLTLVTSLTGDRQMPAPVETPATGRGILTVDRSDNTVSGLVSFIGLSTPTLFAHIHRQNAGEVTGPVLITLEGGDGLTEGAYLVPAGTMLLADEFTGLLNGELYYNIHTETNPPGEIRGQIVAP